MALAFAVAISATAAEPGATAEVVSNGTQRFRDEVFPNVKVTKDVKYTRQRNVGGAWEDLYLDLYEPVGDTTRQRPAIIWAHGGGFAAGNKQGGNEVEMATHLARRGFVVASIDYRIDPGNGWGSYASISQALANDRFFDSLIRATHDVGYAAEHLRAHAGTYQLHPEAIFSSGYSAGAVATLTQAYLPGASNTRPGRLAAVASLAGMTFSFYAEAGEPPAILFHGTKDSSVPYSGAKELCDNIKNRIHCELVTFEGTGHGITPDWEVIREAMADFFYRITLEPLGFTTEINPLGESSAFFPMAPHRLVDTRVHVPNSNGAGGASEVDAGQARTVDTTGSAGVPAGGVSGVVANVTVTNTSAASHLTVWPHGEPKPTTSNLNWSAGETRANLVIVKVDTDGQIDFDHNAGSADVIIDLIGWLAPDPTGDRLHPVAPFRAVDTRFGKGAPASKVGPGGTVRLDPTESTDISPITGAVVNITATGGTAASHLTAWDGVGPLPTASTINWAPGATVANQAVLDLAPDGTFAVHNEAGAVDVIVDVVAWLSPEPVGGRGCVLMTPTRVLDTRTGLGAPTGPLPARLPLDAKLAGTGSIPAAGVGAVLANMTVTGGTAPSHLTVWRHADQQPVVSSLNWTAGQTIANNVIAPLGDGAISIANHDGRVHVIADASGWC